MKTKHINNITELTTFKAALGQFLDNVPDNPPTAGYTAECRNSLPDWNIQSGGQRDTRWLDSLAKPNG